MNTDKLLFLVPYGALPVYLFPAARLADELVRRGDQVEWVKCAQGLLGACPVHYTLKQSHSLASMNRTCSWCRSYQDEVIRISGFCGRVLYSQNPEVEIPDTQDSLRAFCYQDVAVGRLALFCIKHKLVGRADHNFELSSDDFDVWRSHVIAMVSMLNALRQWFGENESSRTQIVTLNMYYPLNSAVVYWCKNRGIPTINFNLGYSVSEVYESYSVSRQPTDSWMSDLARYYEKNCQEIRYSSEDVLHVRKFLESAYGALDVKNYSSSRNWDLPKLQEQLGLQKYKDKYIVLALISSEDEIVGSELFFGKRFGEHPRAAFLDQKAWILKLMQTLSTDPDVVLIVRPHPREVRYYPESWGWLKEHSKQYCNVIINDQPGVSFYDLLDLVDLSLVSISSAAIDSMLVGVPVVSIWPDQTPWALPQEFTNFSDEAGYFGLLSELIRNRRPRDASYGEYSSGFLAFLVGGCNIYFDHNNFWNRSRDIEKKEKERRMQLDLPVLSYEDYSKSWSIKEFEISKLLRFLDSGREIHEDRIQLQSGSHTLMMSDVVNEFRQLYLGHSFKCHQNSRVLNKSLAALGLV